MSDEISDVLLFNRLKKLISDKIVLSSLLSAAVVKPELLHACSGLQTNMYSCVFMSWVLHRAVGNSWSYVLGLWSERCHGRKER